MSEVSWRLLMCENYIESEKLKNKPWSLEDETGKFQYHGILVGSFAATYYLLMMQGKELVAIPVGSWFKFNEVALYNQLTLEEAEEKIKNIKKLAEGYERWIIKPANCGAALFGAVERSGDMDGATVGGREWRKFGGD